MSNMYKDYAKVRQAIDQLQEKEKELKAKILDKIEKTEQTEWGWFTPTRRVLWTYTGKVKRAKKELQTKKEKLLQTLEPDLKRIEVMENEERLLGKAKGKETINMQFRAIKK